jgi:hypothetical protein
LKTHKGYAIYNGNKERKSEEYQGILNFPLHKFIKSTSEDSKMNFLKIGAEE